MIIRAFLVGIFILAVGVFMVVKSRKNISSLEEYESEHCSLDGKVDFKSLQASRTHYANKNLYKVITYTGFFVGLFGIIIIVYGFLL